MAVITKGERLERILGLLKRENGLPIQTIADHLGVSHMTVRRDLRTLVDQELVRLMHGGVLLNPEVYAVGKTPSYSLIAAGSENAQKKRVIGAKAASLIVPNDTLIIDSGSTTEWIARYLPDTMPLTVLSYALNVVTETARRDNCRSVFAGGLLHENSLMFESPEGLAQIRRFGASKAFLSATGVSEDFGVTCANGYERKTKRAVMASATECILVVDSTKFRAMQPEYFADLSQFDTIVTDDGADKSIMRAVKKLGIRLVVA